MTWACIGVCPLLSLKMFARTDNIASFRLNLKLMYSIYEVAALSLEVVRQNTGTMRRDSNQIWIKLLFHEAYDVIGRWLRHLQFIVCRFSNWYSTHWFAVEFTLRCTRIISCSGLTWTWIVIRPQFVSTVAAASSVNECKYLDLFYSQGIEWFYMLLINRAII